MKEAADIRANAQGSRAFWAVPINLATLTFAIAVAALPVYLPQPPSWTWVLAKKNDTSHRYFYPGYMVPPASAAQYRAVTLGGACRQGLAPAPGADLMVRLLSGGEDLLTAPAGPFAGAAASRQVIFWASMPGNRWICAGNAVQFAGGVMWEVTPHPRHRFGNWLRWFYSLAKPRPLLPLTITVLSTVGLVALALALAHAAGRSRRVDLGLRLAAVAMVAVWYAVSWALPVTSTFFAAVSFIWWPAVILLALAPLVAPVLSAWRRKRELGRATPQKAAH